MINKIEFIETATYQIVCPIGRLDLQTVYEHRGLIDATGLDDVLIDLSRLEFIDSSGIGLLTSIMKIKNSQNLKMIMFNMSDTVKRTMERTHLDRLFTVVDTLEDAEKLLKH